MVAKNRHNRPTAQKEKKPTFLPDHVIDTIRSGYGSDALPVSDSTKKKLEPLANDFGIEPAWKKEEKKKEEGGKGERHG